jgi:hypothetical protein
MKVSSSLSVAVALHQLGWGAAVEHAPCVHQRDAVAALGLVHEVGGDEQGHAILARELDHQLPELVAGDGVHARGRLVEDEHVRPVHHGHGQRQALAHAQGQLVGQLVGHVGQLEAGHHLGDARVALRSGHFEDARVQVEVLAHGEFAVERKGLRHVAHAAAHGQVMGVHRLAEQLGMALAGWQQAGEHLHGRGLATAVRAQEPEDLATVDAEVDVVHRREIAKAAGEVVGLDGDVAIGAGAWRNDQLAVAFAALRGQQGDEGGLQRVALGALAQLGRGAGGEHLARIHGDQVVEAFGLFHVGGGHQHAHARAAGADAVDQLPELAA